MKKIISNLSLKTTVTTAVILGVLLVGGLMALAYTQPGGTVSRTLNQLAPGTNHSTPDCSIDPRSGCYSQGTAPSGMSPAASPATSTNQTPVTTTAPAIGPTASPTPTQAPTPTPITPVPTVNCSDNPLSGCYGQN